VILLILLRVVLDEFLDVDLDEVDLGEDFVGSGGPGERLGVAVPVGYVGFTRTRKASVSDKERLTNITCGCSGLLPQVDHLVDTDPLATLT
jgi:hypothetical protein